MARVNSQMNIVVIVVGIAVLALVGMQFVKTIPPGRVGVATLFGNVQPEGYTQGIHIPVNPLYRWTMYDARQKTHLETANVPSQDQLQTKLDVSVQFRIDGSMAPDILEQTGDESAAVRVHLIPKLRSLLREQGKSIKRAEDFFQEATQETLQLALTDGLRDYLAPKGILVSAVLIRDITLPPFIVEAIEQKKEREQAVERERAELERVRTELQQQVARAEAGREAAEQEAAQEDPRRCAGLRNHADQQCDRAQSGVYSAAVARSAKIYLEGPGEQGLLHGWIESESATVDAPRRSQTLAPARAAS